jgi:hypothetical protein
VGVSVIQGKAMRMYDYWKKHLNESATNAPEFHASRGWLKSFKNRVKLHNIRSNGRITTANKQAALEFADV